MAELPGRSQRLSPSAVRLSLEASGRDKVMPLRALSLSAHAENIHPLEADIVEALQAFEKQLTQESPEYALDFDGDRSYVSIPTLLYDSSHPLTYEVFATPRQKGGIVIGNGQFVRTPGGSGIAVQARYNAHWWNGNNFMPVLSKFPVALHSRTHLAATLEGATIRLFVNGQLIGSKALPNSVNRKQLPISIGGSPYGDENLVYAFDGLIDEARVSKTIRYRDSFQVPEKLETDDSTMAHFQFRKGSGTKLFDVSGNDHHGEIKNATWVTGVAINRQAAIGLVTYGTRVVPVLAKALENEDASVRAAVVLGIGQFTRPGNRLQELLQRSLNDPNKEVRDAAKEAFNRINENLKPADPVSASPEAHLNDQCGEVRIDLTQRREAAKDRKEMTAHLQKYARKDVLAGPRITEELFANLCGFAPLRQLSRSSRPTDVSFRIAV